MNLSQGSLDFNIFYETENTLGWTNKLSTTTSMQLWWDENMDGASRTRICYTISNGFECYRGIWAQILMLDPLPNVSRVFNLVVQEERQHTIGLENFISGDSLAFSVRPWRKILRWMVPLLLLVVEEEDDKKDQFALIVGWQGTELTNSTSFMVFLHVTSRSPKLLCKAHLASRTMEPVK